jgi:RNA polymerase sigma factor (sigma-70 family)
MPELGGGAMEGWVDVVPLVAAALEGDQDAWNELVTRYAPLVAAVLVRHRMFGAEADDVTQIVWLRLVEHLGDLREPRALPKWLVVTTRNECLRALRASGRVRPYDPLAEEPQVMVDHATPDEPVLRAERREAVLAAMAELPDRQRAVLWALAEEPDLSYSEVGKRLGMPVGSIGPTRMRAIEKLRASPGIIALSESEFSAEDLGGGRSDLATAGRG